MPVVRSTKNHDDTFHHLQSRDVGGKHFKTPTGTNVHYPQRILPGDQPSVQRRNYTFSDIRGVPSGELDLRWIRNWLTFSICLLGHLTPSQPRASSSYSKRRNPREGSDEDYTGQPNTLPQYIVTNNGQAQSTNPSGTLTEYHYNTGPSTDETHIGAIPGSQEKFDEDVMVYYRAIESSLASQFLNLDDQAPTWGDQIVATGTQHPAMPSSSLVGGAPEQGVEPTSLHLFDMKRFETVTDFDGGEKTVPWPWGGCEYRPPTPLGYLDPEGYVVEHQIAEIEGALRDKLMGVMTQEAILSGEKARRRERREGKMVERKGDKPATVAFNNQAVRGRTIYNP